jgi:hypothetical protein
MFDSGVMAPTHDGCNVWRRSLMDDFGEIQNRHQFLRSARKHRGRRVGSSSDPWRPFSA